MKKWFIVSALLFSTCTKAANVVISEQTEQLFVTVNSHQQESTIYINGVSRWLAADTGLLVGCFEHESTELQIDELLYVVECGVNVDIKLTVQGSII